MAFTNLEAAAANTLLNWLLGLGAGAPSSAQAREAACLLTAAARLQTGGVGITPDEVRRCWERMEQSGGRAPMHLPPSPEVAGHLRLVDAPNGGA
ncbi:hypothetical protein [Streptosporangium saharense]|uniref:hypothetical protein n=1 Tax=Streptosporangium saharense TaxID=1706840 RepID=UPI00331DC16E